MIAILARTERNEIGYTDGSLITRNKVDLGFFKFATLGNTLVMGRKTVDSLPKKLEDRLLICVSRSVTTHEKADFVSPDGVVPNESVICGGAEIYEMYKDIVCLYLVTTFKDGSFEYKKDKQLVTLPSGVVEKIDSSNNRITIFEDDKMILEYVFVGEEYERP